MKPTSIIFLLISLIVILVGWLTFRSAETRAEADGVQIFASAVDNENNTVKSVAFGADEVFNKFELVVDEADIIILGGSPTPALELVNFEEGSYRMTTSNRSVTVDTTIDLMSIVRFWESGFKFRGLRDYFHGGNEKAEKQIRLYLPSDSEVNVIKVTLGKGNVSVANFDTQIDVEVNIKEGSAVFATFETTSMVTAELGDGSLYMTDASVGKLSAVISDGNVNVNRFKFGELDISGDSMNVSIGLLPDMDGFSAHLAARRGDIMVFGESKGSEYSYEADTGKRAIITAPSGDIVIYESEPLPESEDTGGVDTDEGGGADTNENENPENGTEENNG